MKYLIARAGVLALLVSCLVTAGWSQDYPQQLPQPTDNPPPKGEAAPAPTGPVVSKEELDAYNKLVADTRAASANPKQIIDMSEAFITKYPTSMYAGGVYSQMTMAYLTTNQSDKMMEAGEKALAANPNNVDVLPVMAWAVPRLVSSSTPNAAQKLEKAMNYARRGISLLSTMPKPVDIDDATFAKVKNEKLAQCHSGLGTIYLKTGKNEEAIAELSQAVQLDTTPDPVDYYLLGVANQMTSHFTDAIAAFTKCSAGGPMQAQCKVILEDTKKKAQNSLEAPK